MTLQAKSLPLLFEKVRFIPRKKWAVDWLDEAEIGDLLVSDNKSYGMLCVGVRGEFLVVNQEQMFGHEPINWPDHAKRIGQIVLKDSKVSLNYKYG